MYYHMAVLYCLFFFLFSLCLFLSCFFYAVCYCSSDFNSTSLCPNNFFFFFTMLHFLYYVTSKKLAYVQNFRIYSSYICIDLIPVEILIHNIFIFLYIYYHRVNIVCTTNLMQIIRLKT